jgi:ABC-type branched-subunit amino acid transport system permease subunit
VDLYGPRERESYVLDLVYIKIILIIIFLLAERYVIISPSAERKKGVHFLLAHIHGEIFSTLALSLVLVCGQAGFWRFSFVDWASINIYTSAHSAYLTIDGTVEIKCAINEM